MSPMKPAPTPGSTIFRPSELNREVKLHLEAGFPRVWVQGEISNLARPASGHLYFSLKDDKAQIRCALFKGNARGLGTRPENGQEVLVAGRLSLFEPRGDYQLIVDHLLEAGAGRLQEAFEALKKKLEAEGLFDDGKKKPLPGFPRAISVVTSASGAAVRDIVHVLERRWPAARVRIYPATVQGEQAPASIIRALKAADDHRFGDVIILARGGGSLEDLWAFNDESLARTLAGLSSPVISAVGHETDFTIADFVADLRAPTPSAAAELATPDRREIADRIEKLARRIRQRMQTRMEQTEQALDHLHRRLAGRHPLNQLDRMDETLQRLRRQLVRIQGQQVTERQRALESLTARLTSRHPGRQVDRGQENLAQFRHRLVQAGRQSWRRHRERTAAVSRALESVSPLAVLARGYGVIQDSEGQALTRPEDFTEDRSIRIRMQDFEAPARLTGPVRDLDETDG